jgi:hypothetical protein
MPIDRPAAQLPTEIAPADRLLTAAEFHRLADVPPEVEWFANLGNAHTRRAYSGGTLENAQAMAAHESPRTTKLYDRTKERLTLDEVERIVM